MRHVSDKIGFIEHLPSKVAAHITREIAVGNFQPGEHQLADSLGVSRNVVREAISQLRADGVILARQGVGAFVQEPERRSAIRLDTEVLKAEGSMRRLFEFAASWKSKPPAWSQHGEARKACTRSSGLSTA